MACRREHEQSLFARAGQHSHVGITFEDHVICAVHVEQRQRSQSVGHAGRFRNVPQPAERPGQTLHSRVIGRLRPFVQWKQTSASTIISLKSFRVDHPVFPTNVREIQH